MSEKTSNYVNVEYDPPSKTGTFIYGATEWASTEQDFDQETKQVKKKLKKRRIFHNVIDMGIIMVGTAAAFLIGYSYGSGTGYKSGMKNGMEIGRMFERADIFTAMFENFERPVR